MMNKVVVVCGSRDWRDEALIRSRLKRLPRGVILRSGMARGADEIAARLGRSLGFTIDEVPAEWREGGRYDPEAGFKRNTLMLDKKPVPYLVISFWDEVSTGTLDTVIKALDRKIKTSVEMKDEILNMETSDDLEELLEKAQSQNARQRIQKAIGRRG